MNKANDSTGIPQEQKGQPGVQQPDEDGMVPDLPDEEIVYPSPSEVPQPEGEGTTVTLAQLSEP